MQRKRTNCRGCGAETITTQRGYLPPIVSTCTVCRPRRATWARQTLARGVITYTNQGVKHG